MSRFKLVGGAAGMLAICAACTITRALQLYPDNDAGRVLGPLHGSIVGHGNLNGVFALSMPSGEVLNGRYSINVSGEAMADAVGLRGTTAHCEFMNNNFNGHGHGSCRISDGSIYRMQY